VIKSHINGNNQFLTKSIIILKTYIFSEWNYPINKVKFFSYPLVLLSVFLPYSALTICFWFLLYAGYYWQRKKGIAFNRIRNKHWQKLKIILIRGIWRIKSNTNLDSFDMCTIVS
jgi:hypothetical protein